MYRVLCAVFFCMSVASAAPQETGDITFVQPLTGPSEAPPEPSIESLETIPLTTSRENQNAETTPSTESDENHTKPDVSTAIYETSSETTTARNFVSEVPRTEAYVPKVKPWKTPSPRFVSKLGYFKHTDTYNSAVHTNFIERVGKRKFKSHCRCEKITNCPKLQISVARCPEEYFLCCF